MKEVIDAKIDDKLLDSVKKCKTWEEVCHTVTSAYPGSKITDSEIVDKLLYLLEHDDILEESVIESVYAGKVSVTNSEFIL